MNIYLLEKERYPEAVSLSLHVFITCNTADYNEEGLGLFKSFIYNEERMNELIIWGAFQENILVGILGFKQKDNHLSLFFIHPDYQRQGIGRKLFDYMRITIKSKSITVNASTSAVWFYAKLGFCELSEPINYQGLISVPMKWQLLENKE